jgi:hypothetical protein
MVLHPRCQPQLSRQDGLVLGQRPRWVCAVTRRRFPVGANPTRQPLQPEAIGAVMEVTKWLKPSISVSRIGDSASVQAVTRVNAEQSSKRTMRRPTRQPFRGRLIRLGEQSEEYAQPLRRGSGDSMYTRKRSCRTAILFYRPRLLCAQAESCWQSSSVQVIYAVDVKRGIVHSGREEGHQHMNDLDKLVFRHGK